MPERGRTTGTPGGQWRVTMITHEDVPPRWGRAPGPAAPQDPAYQRWMDVSGRALDCTRTPEMLDVIEAALAAMAELRNQVAHLDPVTPPPGTPPGADYQAIYRLACMAGLYAGVAEEALNLLDTLDRTPGNRLLVLDRATRLRTRLDSLDSRNLGT